MYIKHHSERLEEIKHISMDNIKLFCHIDLVFEEDDETKEYEVLNVQKSEIML